MTNRLSEAFQRAAMLPDELQDQLAQELMDELDGELRWDNTLANSQEKLERMAERALQQFREGKTKELGFDEL